MKHGVTISRELHRVTGAIARRLGISRTRVYEKASADLAKREDNQILIALNKVRDEETRHEIHPIIRAAAEQFLFDELEPVLQAAGGGDNPPSTRPAPKPSTHPTDKT